MLWQHVFQVVVCVLGTVQRATTRIDTVISPDDGHTVARNMLRKEMNILRKIVQQVGFICKIIQGSTVNKTQKRLESIRF